MNRFQSFNLQSLEPRALLSAVPHFHLPHAHAHGVKEINQNTNALDDLQKLKDDITQFNADQASFKTTLDADKAALANDRAKLNSDFAPILQQRAADTAQWQATLAADKAAIDAATADPNTTSDALSALQAQMAADQSTAHSVMETTGHALYLAYLADQPAITADQTKLNADCLLASTTLKAEHDQVMADIELVKKDMSGHGDSSNHSDGNDNQNGDQHNGDKGSGDNGNDSNNGDSKSHDDSNTNDSTAAAKKLAKAKKAKNHHAKAKHH